MDNWYRIDNTSEDAKDLLTMFWEFHDFRLWSFSYSPGEDTIDVILEYDSHDMKVHLRFINLRGFNLCATQDHEANWYDGNTISIDDDGNIFWIDVDWFKQGDAVSEFDTWVKSEKLVYAILDKNGEPIEIPDDIKDQTWQPYNYKTHKYDEIEHHFSPKPASMG